MIAKVDGNVDIFPTVWNVEHCNMEMSRVSKIFNFELMKLLKMLHFDANPTRIECLFTELQVIYQF